MNSDGPYVILCSQNSKLNLETFDDTLIDTKV